MYRGNLARSGASSLSSHSASSKFAPLQDSSSSTSSNSSTNRLSNHVRKFQQRFHRNHSTQSSSPLQPSKIPSDPRSANATAQSLTTQQPVNALSRLFNTVRGKMEKHPPPPKTPSKPPTTTAPHLKPPTISTHPSAKPTLKPHSSINKAKRPHQRTKPSSLPSTSTTTAPRSLLHHFLASLRKSTTITHPNGEFNTQYQQYMKRNHPNASLTAILPESTSSPPHPPSLFAQRSKQQILAAKRMCTKIASFGRRSVSYMFGLLLLNELRVILIYDIDFSPMVDSVKSLTEIGYVSNKKVQHIERFGYDPELDHIDTLLDIILILTLNFDRFFTKCKQNPVIDDLVAFMTRRKREYSSSFHSSMLFLDSVTGNAFSHSVSRVFDWEATSWWPFGLFGETVDEKPEHMPAQPSRGLYSPPPIIKALPTDRGWWFGKMFRFPFLVKELTFSYEPTAMARYHYFWPMTIAKWVKEIVYKVALPIIDIVEWVAWAPQKYMAQRIADVFFFFDAKVAYHTRQFVQHAILSRYNIPLLSQLKAMRDERHSSFEISLFLLNYIAAASKESYRIIKEGIPMVTNKDIDTAIEQLEIELQALQNTSQSEVELFAEHYRVYADNLPVYFSERLRPFLVRLSERPYDPLYKYFMFTYDKPASGVAPLQKDELLILDSVKTPYPIWRILTRWDKNTLQLKVPFADWTEHNKLLPAHFVQGFENSLSAGFSMITKMVLWTAVLSKIPMFQRFFYRHLTLSYENRYKPWTYILSSFSSMSITTALLSVFLFSSPFEVYSSMWGSDMFYSATMRSAIAINIATQFTNLTLARSLLALNIHRPALLAPQNGAFPLLTMYWAYTTRAFPDGDLRFFYFPIGTKVDALVSAWLAFDALGFFFFTVLLNRRTGIPHLSNLYGALAGFWLYNSHVKNHGVKPGEDYNLVTDETTLPHVNENIPDSFIFFNVFQEPYSKQYRMKRKMWIEDNDQLNLRYKRNEKWNADIATTQFLEGWNLLYRYSNHRDFVVVEENLNKLRQMRQEWRATFGDEEVKKEVELGIEDKSIPYLMHTARFAQSQLERLQNLVDTAWSTNTGMMTPREWERKEYEMHRSKGPIHSIEHAENFLNYNRLLEGKEYGFQMWVYPDEEEDVMYEPYIRSEAIWENLDQWLKYSDARGAIHWTAKAWEVFRLQPQLYPRMSENQKRWFHPQDEFYELDWGTIRGVKDRRYRQEFDRGPRNEGLWGVKNADPWYDNEGLMNEHERQMMRFSRDPQVREAQMNPLDFPEMHHHPSRLWKAVEQRQRIHKHVTFPKFMKDSSISWGTRPPMHKKNEWFPEEDETDFMDDYDLEEPLFKHGEFNPYISNLQAVRQPILQEGFSPVRGALNVEPRQWAKFERKMWSWMPKKVRDSQRIMQYKPFNLKVPELDKAPGDMFSNLHHQKVARKRNTDMLNAARDRSNMEDIIKGKIFETQQVWGTRHSHMKDEDEEFENFFRDGMDPEWERDDEGVFENFYPDLDF